MDQSIPHGGMLVNLLEPTFNYRFINQEIELDNMALSDLELIATGAYSPIKGFLKKEDYESVVNDMRLADGTVWSIPITLPVTEEKANELTIGDLVNLVKDGIVYGILQLEQLYTPNKEKEAENVYGTNDLEHPGVRRLFDRPEVYASGEIRLVRKTDKGKFELIPVK